LFGCSGAEKNIRNWNNEEKDGITTDSLAKYITLHMQQYHKCHIDAELFCDTFYWRSLILVVESERPCTLGS
jgi:hypothetical protein